MARGRKPGEKKGYFYKREEDAVVAYINSTDKEEKDRIYNTVLKPAFEKMIESIIRRYRYYIPNEEFNDTFNDTLSFLLTKTDKFKPSKGKKAYSYYGTVCKNYLIGRIEGYSKTLQRNPSYDVIADSFNDNVKYSSDMDGGSDVAKDTVSMLIERITDMVDHPEESDLKPNEVKLGKALVNLLDNWEYVLTTDASNKLNKNAILLFLRETTGLDTKGVRDNMRKFKKEFILIKGLVIE